jgi:hypothetical protein
MKQISEEEEKPFPSSSVDISLKDELPSAVPSWLKEKLSALKKKYPTSHQMKFFNIYLFLWVILVLLDPDPDQQHW